MYLKRLEIQGFKSMANRVELEFNPGITAVVGPNGSGKSNISDSIRWVLGEQSAKSLRGAKMEDIIFSGSDKRKPVGMAEVVMTIDNTTGIFPSEYSEITVTRRVFRSGDSEFFINKTPCRLKDIHELFMDTGIGREGYSIIGQGKIDEILSAKTDERRQIIEEAAGIVKYKNRKIQAVRKLQDTEQNLVRIGDIISELENQVGPLGEQAEKAKTYLAHKEELDQLEISLSVQQLSDQKARLENLTSEEENLRHSIISLETEVRKTDSEIEELKYQLNKTNEDINLLQQEIYEKTSSMEKLESEIRVNKERVNNLSERKERLDKEVNELENKIKKVKEQSKDDSEAHQNVLEKIKTLEKDLSEVQQQIVDLENDNKNKLDEIEHIKGEIIETLNGIANLNNQLHALDAEENSLKRRKEQLDKQISDSRSDKNELEQKLIKIVHEEEVSQSKLQELQKRVNNTTSKIEEVNNNNRQLQKELQNYVEKKQASISRLRVLEDMEADFEGYNKGVREILIAAKKGRTTGVCGVVADLISVPKQYETAIEVALGGALQFVVTKTDSNAKEAINYLKKNNAGRATFLPLNNIKARDIRNLNVLKINGCIGIAAELISFSKEFEPAVKNLLGNILVAQNIDSALNIARSTDFGVKIVTIDGDVINPGGSLTGGSYNKKRSNLLGRKREIEELTKNVNGLDEKITVIRKKETQSKQTEEQLAKELIEIKEQIQSVNYSIAGLEKEKEQMEIQLDKLNQTIEVYEYEALQVSESQNDINTQRTDKSTEIQELKSLHGDLTKKADLNQQDFSQLETKITELNELITTKKIDLAKYQQEELGYRQTIERVNKDIQEIQEQIDTKIDEINTLAGQEKELTQKIEEIKNQITVLQEGKTVSEETLNGLKNNRDYLEGQVKGKEDGAKNKNKEFSSFQNQLHNIEVRKARLETEIKNEQSKLMEEFELTYEQALLKKTEIGSKKEASGRIKELKNAINQLGAINVAAIEEYQHVSERYEFLTAQAKDLEQAKDSLYKVIKEMDQIMSKRFAKAYEQINENFKQVFKELFGGGYAELQLTDKENILETGVDILAQPPGKKPQHLSLLSGGERALTAIGLLFAVLMVKPSPFCVLDEIEASLDEANVDRYASFLQKFSESTQFIVITHRKGTMEAANVLYGVTMDEAGVSKMVSMKLSDAVDKVS